MITFERANVVHMGDLAFHRRHPVVDRAAGASMRNWAQLLEQVAAAHARDTVYVFGHAAAGLPITGGASDLLALRDYLAGCRLRQRHVAAGRSRARSSRCARRWRGSRCGGVRAGERARPADGGVRGG